MEEERFALTEQGVLTVLWIHQRFRNTDETIEEIAEQLQMGVDSVRVLYALGSDVIDQAEAMFEFDSDL